MRDRRRVDDLSVDELQRVLAEKKQVAREARLARFRESGRALPVVPVGVMPEADQPAPAARRTPRSPLRRLLDGLLLIVEVAAVAGLVYVFYNGANILENLNREAAAAMRQEVQALPTIAPTPILTAVVLPGGHTPPTAPGGARPNNDEIPAHLRQVVQALPAPVVPTQGPQQAVRLVIPVINVDAPIVPGDDWEQLKKGVGQHLNDALPGQAGNLVLSAHNDIYGEIFRHLDQLQPGDEVQVHTFGQIFTYVIGGSRVVEPTEVSVLAPTPHSSLTLISCYPYLIDNQRIVVTAELKDQ